MDFRKLTRETILYAAAFGLALFLRLLLLGSAPLNDGEAGWALQALGLAHERGALIGPQAAYITWTSALLDFFGSTNFMARLLPALAGSALTLAPLLLRRTIGRKPALMLAFALALDAGLLAISRQAGGTMLAVCAAGFALAAWLDRRTRLAGFFAGLALLGGPSIWPGLAGLAAAAALGSWLLDGRQVARSAEPVAGLDISEDGNGQIAEERVPTEVTVPDKVSVYPSPANGDVHATEQNRLGPWSRRGPLAQFFAFATLALLVVGTLFFTHPQALSAAGASLPAYLQSWGSRGSLPGTWWLAILGFYAPIPLVFGLWGAARGWLRGEFVDRWLSFWVLAALIIAVVNPGRQPADLIWVILPLWILAARDISRHLFSGDVDPLPAFGQAALTVLILIFTWMNLGGWLTALSQNLPDARLYALVFVGALALLFVSAYLVTWGWSMRTGLRGLVWGILAGLCLYTVSAGSLAGGYRSNHSAELWTTSPVVEQVDLLVKTAADLSEQRFTNLNSIDLVAENVDSAALRWALRDFSAARFENQVAVDAQPSVIVSGQAEQPTLIAGYRGQDFILNRSTEWSSFTGYDWLNWLVYRKAPGSTQTAILWARNDLFPGGETVTAGGSGE